MPLIAPDSERFHHTLPPPFESCVTEYERDARLPPADAVPVDRVLVLGAGFSAQFGFSTSAGIVFGVVDFFQRCPTSSWHQEHLTRVVKWLNLKHPNWQRSPPDLTDFVKDFFAPGWGLASQGHHIDPLSLAASDVSWERGNFDEMAWKSFPALSEYNYFLLSFEVLLCTYLFAGLAIHQVLDGPVATVFQGLTSNDAVLTFNWDVIPEVLLTSFGRPFSRYEWRRDRIKLIKLHGSIDILGRPNDHMRADTVADPPRLECITPCTWRAITSEVNTPRAAPWPFGRPIFPWERYNKSAVLIMPPYYTLGYGYELIQFNWRKARTALQRAKEVHIVGYSLTEHDVAFHRMLRSVAAVWRPETWVRLWNLDDAVYKRACRLCGGRRVDFYKMKAESLTLGPPPSGQ